jgi:hypothetical protein
MLGLEPRDERLEVAEIRVDVGPLFAVDLDRDEVLWASGVSSAFITNDAVCVLGAPIVVRPRWPSPRPGWGRSSSCFSLP